MWLIWTFFTESIWGTGQTGASKRGKKERWKEAIVRTRAEGGRAQQAVVMVPAAAGQATVWVHAASKKPRTGGGSTASARRLVEVEGQQKHPTKSKKQCGRGSSQLMTLWFVANPLLPTRRNVAVGRCTTIFKTTRTPRLTPTTEGTRKLHCLFFLLNLLPFAPTRSSVVAEIVTNLVVCGIVVHLNPAF